MQYFILTDTIFHLDTGNY